MNLAKKKKRRKPTRKRSKQILAINQDHKKINGKHYYANVGYKSKARALIEAKNTRKRGKYFATVRPYYSKTMKGKRSKWYAVYACRKK